MIVLVLATSLAAAAASPPIVTPWFLSRHVEDGPAFLIECRNTTGAVINSGSAFWALDEDDFRIDGKRRPPQSRMGPGLVSPIPPGGTWRGILELRQVKPRTSYAVALDAHTRKALLAPLTPGRHTIAVRCGDTWSADVPFYWER
jgi:hypothetical protein